MHTVSSCHTVAVIHGLHRTIHKQPFRALLAVLPRPDTLKLCLFTALLCFARCKPRQLSRDGTTHADWPDKSQLTAAVNA